MGLSLVLYVFSPVPVSLLQTYSYLSHLRMATHAGETQMSLCSGYNQCKYQWASYSLLLFYLLTHVNMIILINAIHSLYDILF